MIISRAASSGRPAAASRQQDDRFQRLLKSNIIGIVTAVSDKIEAANDAFLTMIDYSRDELEAGEISWRHLTPPEYAYLDDKALAELAERGECTPFRKEYIRRDGTRVPILIGAVTIAHEPLESICFIIDRTAQHEAEVNLARVLAEKEILLRQKDILLREVNHRIKNNLQIVSSLLSRQRSRVQAPEAKTALGEAIARVSAISAVHERLYKAGDTADVEIGSYLRSLCEDACRSGLIDPQRCRIAVDAEALVLPIDRATTVALITTELLMNVAKYCTCPGRDAQVKVRLRRQDGGMRLEVEDNGPGMPPDFDPHRSAGLGIKIVTALTRQYGGQVRFEALMPGTRVVVEWPTVWDPLGPGRA